jgi:hypothetical protein
MNVSLNVKNAIILVDVPNAKQTIFYIIIIAIVNVIHKWQKKCLIFAMKIIKVNINFFYIEILF